MSGPPIDPQDPGPTGAPAAPKTNGAPAPAPGQALTAPAKLSTRGARTDRTSSVGDRQIRVPAAGERVGLHCTSLSSSTPCARRMSPGASGVSPASEKMRASSRNAWRRTRCCSPFGSAAAEPS